ncbi:unnamed protein product, partial [Rotaria magnacalcarata]
GNRGPLHLCDLHGSVAAGKKLKVLLGLGSSKPWEDILEEFAGVKTFSAKSCLKYFQPLRDYLEKLVAEGQLNVGWKCENNGFSTRSFMPTTIWLILILKFILSNIFFPL